MSKLKRTKQIAVPQSRWSQERLYNDGDAYYRALSDAIRTATSSIDFEAYIFSRGPLGQRFIEDLIVAASRGVAVRVIVDGVGSWGWGEEFGERLHSAGVKFRVFHAVPWERWDNRRRFESFHRRFFKFFSKVNRRDHRKIQIFDDTTAFVGSFNITEEHSREFSQEHAWRDTAAQVRGDDVAVLKLGFEFAWSSRIRRVREWPKKRKKLLSSTSLVRLNIQRRQRNRNYHDLLYRIVHAKNRVWITNAYFIPDGSLVDALEQAAKAGIDVKIVVPQKSDVFFIPWVSSAFHYGLLKAGVEVYQYKPSMLHAKTILIDDWGLVGSSNLNHRSLLHDLEADVVLLEEDSIRQLESDFKKDLSESSQTTIDSWSSRPWLERIAGKILLLFRDIM